MVHHWACVSKKMGFVCIRYQVGTGYMDSLLEHHPQSTRSVRLGQQNFPGVFQQSDTSVPTKNLVTKSFGDDTRHSFLESDIQRLAGVLCVKLEDKAKIGQLGEVSNKAHNAVLELFSEIKNGLDFWRLPPGNSEEYILLFFKLYNPKDKELCFVEGLFINALLKPSDVLTKVNEMAGFMPYQQSEACGARVKFMYAGISYKYSHEPTLGLLHHFLQLCKYSCSSSPCFAPTDACIIVCKMISQNLDVHPINLCSF